MNKEQAVAAFRELQKKRHALMHMEGLLTCDGDTVAPRESTAGRSLTLGVLAEYSHALLAGEETAGLLEELESMRSELSFQEGRELTVLGEECRDLRAVPEQEYVAYTQLVSDACGAWYAAKERADFPSFAPYLERIVDVSRRLAGYYDSTRDPYDVLLDKNEKGASRAGLDPFFDAVEQTVTPLLRAVREAGGVDGSCLAGRFPRQTQEQLSRYVMDVMGIPEGACSLGETEHPFTTGFNKHDVRITTHYYEDDFTDSLFSVLHEGGHALYELGTDDALEWTCLRGGWDGGMHESQSRFYENYIGRSRGFLGFLLPKLRELFPDTLSAVTEEELYRAVNRAQPGPVRIQADELTYPLHILVRYRLEKALLDGSLKVKDLPGEWNRLYRAYLGVEVANDAEGCLQDIHWACGMLGYFPTYALGSAYGAQYRWAMKRDLPFDGLCASGNVSALTDWLREHIQKYGKLLEPAELVERATGAPFDPAHYTGYLTEKYTGLYRL